MSYFFPEVTGVHWYLIVSVQGDVGGRGGGNYISYREVYSPCNPHVADR